MTIKELTKKLEMIGALWGDDMPVEMIEVGLTRPWKDIMVLIVNEGKNTPTAVRLVALDYHDNL